MPGTVVDRTPHWGQVPGNGSNGVQTAGSLAPSLYTITPFRIAGLAAGLFIGSDPNPVSYTGRRNPHSFRCLIPVFYLRNICIADLCALPFRSSVGKLVSRNLMIDFFPFYSHLRHGPPDTCDFCSLRINKKCFVIEPLYIPLPVMTIFALPTFLL